VKNNQTFKVEAWKFEVGYLKEGRRNSEKIEVVWKTI